ncbi:MAG: cytochrome c [Gammaproteobacteria bacterium]|nr:cytochrome c [Gammaproteobacteria bacterium]
MQKTLAATLITLVALAGSAGHAEDGAATPDIKRGAMLADTCMGCHGIPGYRNAYPSFRVPKLGGQHPEYIVIALQGYQNQTRPHDTMHAQAVSLSEQDMRNIAAFFASEGAVEPAANLPAAPEKAATCAACHGEGGVSVAPNWPILAGQHRDYLEHALHQYKAGERKDPIMGSQALMLDEKDIRELAAWFAARPGLFTVHYSKK